MPEKLLRRVGVAAWLFGIGLVRYASAQQGTIGGGNASGTGSQTSVSLPNPLGSINNFQAVVAAISNFLVMIAIPLVAVMALIGGFQMITAGGSPEKFANGRKTLMYAAIGFAVVVLASGIVSIIKNLFGGK
ncbi:MAG TPA: pilin [Candidatus Paceibacterota bacterium]|nr:pilin [Candidatus Paceibacterota bacterium]